ncbi:MAG: hypothetical protein GWP59_06885, partial [Chlamydiales bacterium]|nr:hypothetical protein [Chlamydiales bacterium]
MSDVAVLATSKAKSLPPSRAYIGNGPIKIDRDNLRTIISFISAAPPTSIPEVFSLRTVNKVYCEQTDYIHPSIAKKIRGIIERNILNSSLDMGRARALYRVSSSNSPRLISSYLQMLFQKPGSFCHIYVYPSDLTVLPGELFNSFCMFIANSKHLKSFSLYAEQGQQLSSERTLQLIKAIKTNSNIEEVSWCISFKQAQNGPLMKELSGKELSLTDYIWVG